MKYMDLIKKIPLKEITSKKSYVSAMKYLEKLMVTYDLENKKFAGVSEYCSVLALLLEDYEKQKFRIETSSPAEVLKFLISQHGMTQHDLVQENIFSSQSNVSEVLRGNRTMTPLQIRNLSERFGISAECFLPAAELKLKVG